MRGATGVVLTNEVIDELLVRESVLDEFAEKTVELVDEFVAGGDTLELKLLLGGGVGEMVDEMTDELVRDTGTLELEPLLRLNDVELTDVLDMGYKTLLELVLPLDMETRLVPVLSVFTELLAVVLSLRLLESVELDDMVTVPVPSELLVVVLPSRVEGMLELEEDIRSVDDPELDGLAVFVEDAELEGLGGRKMTMAKTSPGATVRLCASIRINVVHDEELSTKEAAWQLSCSAHSKRQSYRGTGMSGKLLA
jgi:hypothetical protein